MEFPDRGAPSLGGIFNKTSQGGFGAIIRLGTPEGKGHLEVTVIVSEEESLIEEGEAGRKAYIWKISHKMEGSLSIILMYFSLTVYNLYFLLRPVINI